MWQALFGQPAGDITSLLEAIKRGDTCFKQHLRPGQSLESLLDDSDAGPKLLRAAACYNPKAFFAFLNIIEELVLSPILRLTGGRMHVLSDAAGIKDERGRRLLHWAAFTDNSGTVAELLEEASSRDKDKDGRTPLHYAAWSGAQGSAYLLMAAKANATAKDQDGMTPLHLACATGDAGMVSLLLAMEGLRSGGAPPASPMLLCNLGWAPAHMAACAGSVGALRALHGARPDSVSLAAGAAAGDQFSGYTPLHCAVACGEAEAVDLLLGWIESNRQGTVPVGLTKLATSWGDWRSVWQQRAQLPRFLTALGQADPLDDPDAASEAFEKVRQAFKEGLRRMGLSVEAEVPGGPRAWSFEVPWSAITDKPGAMTERPPAAGGFGEVYRATYNSHTTVALKRLTSGSPEDLQREFAFMRSLPPHDHITPLYGITTDPSTRQSWLVMAWYPLDLHRLFKGSAEHGGPLRLGKKLEIALELAEGLLFLHSHGVVHRDVKPDNVLLTRDLRVKVTDFGISRAVAPGGELNTVQGNGNPLWLAPEVQAFRGTKPAYTNSVDVYGWGVIFCQLISTLHHRIFKLLAPELISLEEGRPPWHQQLYGRQLADPEALRQLPALLVDKLPPHLEPMPPALSEAALALARDCLRLDPTQRPSMGEVVERARALVESMADGPAAPAAEQPLQAGGLLPPAVPLAPPQLPVGAPPPLPPPRAPNPFEMEMDS
ncbi:hypothetical protein HYH03_012278 [Edaphochlamys debaryana]|uniref:Protein kinase domain-containing protein n=1 Tax=Edaphochlamys debaryana TaxID=47281 RepID=A0A835XS81_9CHLO|nr:hypothetical protein HYH03_012278 [Edaphochlamys debaryana]|eukprot:KAG2489258.1 hypothetical protein HYH03_012278 [Edaphochlamys debaryana]